MKALSNGLRLGVCLLVLVACFFTSAWAQTLLATSAFAAAQSGNWAATLSNPAASVVSPYDASCSDTIAISCNGAKDVDTFNYAGFFVLKTGNWLHVLSDSGCWETSANTRINAGSATIKNPNGFSIATAVYVNDAEPKGTLFVAYYKSTIMRYRGENWATTSQWRFSGCGGTCLSVEWDAAIYHAPSNRAYFGLQSGKLLSLDPSDSASDLTTSSRTFIYTVGAGTVSGIASGNIRGTEYLFIGTTLGLLTQWDVAAARIANIGVFSPAVSATPLRALVVDAEYRTLWFTADERTLRDNCNGCGTNTWIGRMDIEDSELSVKFSTATAKPYRRINALYIHQAENAIYAATATYDDGGFSPKLLKYSRSNCTASTCSDCGATDTHYCGWFTNSGTCGLNDGTSFWTQPPKCPAILSINKNSVPTAGGAGLVITGENFHVAVSSPQNNFRCKVGANTTPATSATATTITCAAPAGSGTGQTFTVEFQRSVGNWVPVAGSFSFDYYDCNTLTCSTCNSSPYPDCAWCFAENGCRASVSCLGSKSTTGCSAVNSITPAAISVNSAVTTLTIKATQLPPPDTSYYCKFEGESALTSATYAAATTSVSCLSPASPSAGMKNVEIYMGSSPATAKTFTALPSTVKLDVYNCSTITACFVCLNSRPDCQFCRDQQICSFLGDAGTTCTDSSTSLQSCPQITQASVTNLHTTEDANSVISFTISNGQTPSNLRCNFQFASGTAQTVTPEGDSTNTNIKCKVPGTVFADTLPVGPWTMELVFASNGVQYSNPTSGSVYACSGTTGPCGSCFDAAKPKCVWCSTSSTCDTSAIMGTCTADLVMTAATCPSFTASVLRDTVVGGLNVTVTLSRAPSTTNNVDCKFGSVAVVPATLTSSNNVFTCTAPNATFARTVDLSITVGGNEYTSAKVFTFYDCATASDGSARTCLDCTNQAGCGWCGSGCAAFALCPNANPQCPHLVSVTPTQAEMKFPTIIRIQASADLQAGFEYECIFDGTHRTAASVVGPIIECPTPQLTSSKKRAVATLQVGVVGAGFWADEPFSFEFFSCPATARACGETCSQFEHCGWCTNTGSCSGQVSCVSVAGNTALWYNETCPQVDALVPNQMQVAKVDRPIITEVLTVNVTGFNPSDAFRLEASPSDFACNFGPFQTNVTSIDYVTNQMTCTAPLVYDEAPYSLYISYQGHRLVGESESFRVQDCLKITPCGLCVLQSGCGWCRGSVECQTAAWCANEPITLWAPSCPVVRRLEPQLGYVTGGETIKVTGTQFIPGIQIRLQVMEDTPTPRFTEINSTYVNAEEISFVLPPAISGVGVVNVFLYYNGREYLEDDLSFNYIAVPEPAPVGLIAGLSSAAAIVALGAAGALIFMKSRKVGLFYEFKLVEPDYALVAFGTLLTPQWRCPKDNYDILAQKLLSKDTSFLLSVIAITASTEQDPVARSLAFFYEWHKKSVEFSVILISDECFRNKTENTIFRNNSMASKLFKFYSKIVGIKYLFQTLARFIVELENLSGGKKKSGESVDGSKSLLSMEMEVDPNKFADQSFTDSEANVYQLILACQKVFSAIRSTHKELPREFKNIFQSMRDSIVAQFNSEDAVLKAVGGFLFLRFICPALTAPHAYGLLQAPPNPVCQRQLVLIGKVIQNLANMTMPGAKEQFMQQLNDFFSRNIPKMKNYFEDLLTHPYDPMPVTAVVVTTDTVRNNALAQLWDHIHTNQNKLRAHFDTVKERTTLNETLSELMELYPKKPKKADAKDAKGKKDKGGDD